MSKLTNCTFEIMVIGNGFIIIGGDLSWITSPLSGCPFGSDLEYGIEWPFTSVPATTVTLPCGEEKTGIVLFMISPPPQ